MKIGLHMCYWWGTQYSRDVNTMIELCAKTGVDYVEMNPRYFMQLSSGERRDMRKYAEDMGIRIATRASFGEALAKLGKANAKIVALDADLAGATMSGTFQKTFPERHFNCGIAEGNMVTVACGMSSMDLIPFCSSFAVFLGRCFENIRNGVCYPRANVKFGFTHAGISIGEDGGTHQAIEDMH